MFVSSLSSRARRRGVVLVLVLGMLGLLALIGVTFATFSNQAQINSRNFSQAASFPDANEVMDYALQQLIDDTTNPQSVIRGHSLKRDMYGNDALNNGYMPNLPDGSPILVTSAQIVVNQTTGVAGQLNGTLQVTTNIPGNSNATYGQIFYGYDFTRWVMRFPPAQDSGPAKAFWVGRTHEILYDDPTGTTRVFYVAIPSHNVATSVPGGIPALFTKVPPNDPNITGYTGVQAPELQDTSGTAYTSQLMGLPPALPVPTTAMPGPFPFVLDGRFLRAFNGPGVSGANAWGLDTSYLGTVSTTAVPPHPLTEYANFRYNGNLFLNAWNNGNWLNTPGKNNASWTPTYTPIYGDPNDVVHCPAMDEDYDACDLENWFLAIQSADGQVVIPSFHRPGILGVNPTNTLDNDWTRTISQATTPAQQLIATRAMSRILRPRQADGNSPLSFPDLVPDSKTGVINYDVDNDGDGQSDSVWLDLGYPPKRNPEGQIFKPLFSFMVIGLNGRLPLNTAGNLANRSNTLNPLFDHADHLGNSPSEIDLRFALQNAYDETDTTQSAYSQYDNTSPQGGTTISPYTYANPATNQTTGISIALTQLRNLLAGTRPYVANVNYDQNFVYAGPNNPFYVPNGIADGADTLSGTAPNGTVVRGAPPIAGRWGEADAVPGYPSWNLVGPAYNNLVRAGYSVVMSPGGNSYDARDDNFNTFDFNGENFDLYDASGSITLPVERIRRFVTPIDISGDGQVLTYGTYPKARNNGGDIFGRVNFLGYFRPPGMPVSTFSGTLPAATLPPVTQPAGLGHSAVWITAQPIGSTAQIDVRTNNIYHGYSTALSPNPGWVASTNPATTPPTPAAAVSTLAFAGMPSDIPAYLPSPGTNSVGTIQVANPATPTPPTITPNTYTTQPGVNPPINSNPLFLSPGLNEADEMDLYGRGDLDAPFGPADLEWLYRLQDVDGPSLHSRLALLAPVSFLNPKDSQRRRRLFSVETWDTTNFVWANDNPQGVFPNNSRFNPAANAGFQTLNYSYNSTGNTNNMNGPVVFHANPGLSLTYPTPVNLTPMPDPAADFSAQSLSGNRFWVDTPSIAHRDRKVNLNFPLPVSNSQIEPVRQKWIRETYQLLKATLPPKAVDTPEELAQLSQYVVNVIDFRDPDCTMTKFINTDVWVTEPATAAGVVQANLSFSTSNAPATAYDPVANAPALGAATHYLVQYGMEYPPVAINEVLAYQFQTKIVAASTPTGDPRNNVARMFVELVNTLTKDAVGTNSPDTADLDLNGWEFVVQPDDAWGRPDPFTGQVPMAAGVATGVPLSGFLPGTDYTSAPGPLQPPVGALGSSAIASTQPTGATGPFVYPPDSLFQLPPATNPFIPYYYVFGNNLPTPVFTAPAKNPLTAPTVTGTAPNRTYTSTYEAYPPLPSTINVPPATPPSPPTPAPGYVDLTPYLRLRADYGDPTKPFNPGQYYWLYLRRPANPFDTGLTAEKVVVDSFRFAFIPSTGKGYTDPATGKDTVGPSPAAVTGEYIFSLQRVQPFRGGHAVPPLGSTSTAAGTPATVTPAYGYSEQTVPPPATLASPTFGSWGTTGGASGTAVKSTGKILHTMNVADTGSTTTTPYTYPVGSTQGRNNPTEQVWDYLPFNDRDFTSVVELMTVPACPPGLFTKQFVELAPPYPSANYQDLQALVPTAGPSPGGFDANVATWTNSPWKSGPANPAMLFATNAGAHTFPYLNDEFFYTGVSEPVPPGVAATGGYVSGEATNASTPPAYYRGFTADANGNHNYIGGPGGAGYFKMLDFFEVPSPAFKAIGEVAQGVNYDWARQDLKPGLLNLNLIIDEEVFLGLMGGSMYGNMNQGQIGMPGSTTYSKARTPSVVTLTTDAGVAANSYHMNNVGAFDPNGFVDPFDGATYPNFLNTGNTGNARMKACFADFLSLRHGGSGYLFAFSTNPVFAERPFHSLSYPDINYTILRPATLPPPTPNPQTTNAAGTVTGYPWQSGTPLTAPGAGALPQITWDPAIKNPYLYTSTVPVQPPPVPPRRLFQIPDAWGSPGVNIAEDPQVFKTANGIRSNASIPGDPNADIQTALNTGLTILNTGTAALTSPNNPLTAAYPDLTAIPFASGTDMTTSLRQYQNPDLVKSEYLGGNAYGSPANGLANTTPTGGSSNLDQSDHPWFRYEWLQKVANLTTVRTHQYAVWITVGFFEVLNPGDPQLASNPSKWAQAYDTFGLELGALDGKNIRYRGFFIVDRTRATGFNPFLAGDFRDCVVYRQLIE